MKTIQFYVLILCCCFTLQSQTVCITKTGKKYHKTACNYLKYSKQEIALKQAKELGYLPCKVCTPEILVSVENNQNENSIKKSKILNYKNTRSVQCSGKTKSNRRCKRKTKNSNGRCYQH